jgi:hypothetical protein
VDHQMQQLLYFGLKTESLGRGNGGIGLTHC